GVQTIDLLISNFDDGNHPYHLHGYKFWVLAQGHGYPPRKSLDRPMDLDNLSPLYESLDLTNPMRRDTASVEAFGWALIRFIADNPGAWAFHCHVSWHAEAGLLMQFITRTDLLIDSEISEAHRELCRADGLEKGMGPKDEIYYDEA
ncbi:putative multicopper oxidase, type 1, partial [Aureobasidium melanogenum]